MLENINLLYVISIATLLCFEVANEHSNLLYIFKGGNAIMVIELALMLLKAGFPTGVCVVRSRWDNQRQG